MGKFVQTDWSDFVKFWIFGEMKNSEKTILTVLEFCFDKFLIDFWNIYKFLIKNRAFKILNPKNLNFSILNPNFEIQNPKP